MRPAKVPEENLRGTKGGGGRGVSCSSSPVSVDEDCSVGPVHQLDAVRLRQVPDHIVLVHLPCRQHRPSLSFCSATESQIVPRSSAERALGADYAPVEAMIPWKEVPRSEITMPFSCPSMSSHFVGALSRFTFFSRFLRKPAPPAPSAIRPAAFRDAQAPSQRVGGTRACAGEGAPAVRVLLVPQCRDPRPHVLVPVLRPAASRARVRRARTHGQAGSARAGLSRTAATGFCRG